MSANNVEAEYMDITNRNAWTLVFQKIARESQNFQYTCMEARKVGNKPLNRYRDVNPYDHTRVILQRSEQDYINANLLTVEKAERKYILTQGPLPLTVGHFWLMVWERDSRAILMLNKVIEKNEIKCHWYWPHGVGPDHKITLADVQLTIEQISEEDHNYYTTRTFKIEDLDTSQSREVIQFHYTTWPDFGVPSSPVAFLDFLQQVRASGALEADVGPAVVHCSAGIGRSGTFCLVDSCLVMIENDGLESVNVQEVLIDMRRNRMGLIQTPDQLRFSYKAIIEGVKHLDPDYKPPAMDESIYSQVDEEAPPPPPPRGESLGRPPARPLPAIPASTSLGDMQEVNRRLFEQASSSEDDESPPPRPPPRDPPSPAISASDEDEYAHALLESETASDTPSEATSEAGLRRRAAQTQLADRISAMKRKAQAHERWHSLKRSLYKPLTITFGVLLASILVYSYVRR